MIDGLHVSVRDRVAYLTIDRPERRNALSYGLVLGLTRTLVELDGDMDVWAITVTGAGELAFSAGADLKESDDRARAGAGMPPQPMHGVERDLFEVMLEVGKPTVAVLNGPALGGGCELALACDLRIAAEHAYLALPEAKRGMGANFGSVMLARLVPRAIAFEMLYTGEPVSAQQAQAWGLINRVVPAAELEACAEELVRRIVANAPLTVQRFKHMITKGSSLPVPSALRLNVGPNPYTSRDREEGVRAFVEKRPPRWEGR